MRILFPFTGDTVGGSHVASGYLIKALKKRELEPVVFLHYKGSLAGYFDAQGIEYMVYSFAPVSPILPLPFQILAMFLYALPLALFLKKHRIDIVHTNDLRMHYTWLCAAKMAGCRFVWHQHSITDSPRLGLFAPLIDRGVTVSEYCKQGFHPRFQDKVLVVDNPFDTNKSELQREENRAALRKTLGLVPEMKIIGAVGNLTAQKNPLFFLNVALKLLQDPKAPLHFVLIGDAQREMGAQVKTFIQEYGLSGHVTLMGAYFPADDIITGMDILIAPGIKEGFGRSIVEAMLCRTPVIASHEGGHSEIIVQGKTGFLEAQGDVEAFVARAHDLLISSDLAKKIADAAFQSALARFSVSRHCDEMEKIYSSL